MAAVTAPKVKQLPVVPTFDNPFHAWEWLEDHAIRNHMGQRVKELNSRVGMCRAQTIQKIDTLSGELGLTIDTSQF